jgi:hypothetical protein
VIHLRGKGHGIDGREENAEAMLMLRAAALSGRWEETRERVQMTMATDRRRDWRWKAPDIEEEWKSAQPIRPPTLHPQCSEHNETIAA